MSTLLQPGDRCAGHEILRHLGTGRSAEVYAARGPDGGLRAFKLMGAPGADKQKARFGQEGEALASIVHPNVIRVYDAGAWNERVWLSLELFEGTTLEAWLRTERPSLDDILHVIQQACDGLAEAHRLGIVHRGLCPEDVLIGPGGMVKVIDFGMAKLAAFGVKTTADQQIGKARYLAPEYTRGDKASPRMDVYALGFLLYEAIAGEHPMGAEPRNLMMTLQWHLREQPRPLRERAPWASPELSALVDQMCEKDPSLRPQSMMEVHARLREERTRLRAPQLRSARNAAPIHRALAFAPTVPMPVAPDMAAPAVDPNGASADRAAVLPAAPSSYDPPIHPGPLGLGASNEVRSTDVPVESAARQSRAAPRTAMTTLAGLFVLTLALGAAAWMLLGPVIGPTAVAPSEARKVASSPAGPPSTTAPSASASAAKPPASASASGSARARPARPAKAPSTR